jgi:acyl transferase domain-containing protein/NAD(P)-dependent dehydrogenase (short-subunit alcohol dehydrogenase family)
LSGLHIPLAVVAMNCCLPGADDEGSYWSLLEKGEDAIVEMPPDRLDRDLRYHSEPGELGKTYSTLAGLTAPQTFPEEELKKWDVCHLAFLQVAQQAWRSTKPVSSEKVGVYVGHSGGSEAVNEAVFADLIDETLSRFGPEYASLAKELKPGQPSGRETPERGTPLTAAKLVSNRLGLGGPAMVIEAACASSLVALATAGLALERGDIECALVGGASYAKADSLVLFSQARSCSAKGSRPFDQDADGLVGSEGYVCLAIKTLAQARKDKDTIRAVIRGIGLATDGRGRSLWAPRKEGQILALQRAYKGLDPGEVTYIEAHATSTQVGDATELEALAEFFGPHVSRRKIPIGSVKSNIGHTLETAGLAGMAKVILSLENDCLPASIKVCELNKSVDWDEIPFEVLRQKTPWDGEGLIGVSAFGIGGLNVHVVVEKYNPRIRSHPHPNGLAKGDTIVIVGRGCVANGIPNLRALEEGKIPSGRVTDYRFDGIPLRIPPRLIERGDPLGFMLLDAAGQALRTASLSPQRTSVLVATSFGNRFTDGLQMGLQLPRIEKLLRTRFDSAEVDRFRQEYLTIYPALLDESGGFTASSLASRIAKTHNLMGGALALDSGEHSSAEVLKLATSLLLAGDSEAVLCCSGERSSAHPTEGAVVLLLKTSSQARRDGDLVLGTLPTDESDRLQAQGPFGAAEGLMNLLLSTVERQFFRFQLSAASREGLLEKLAQCKSHRFVPSEDHRFVAIAPTARQLEKRMELARHNPGQRDLLEKQGAYFLTRREPRTRVAFCFAGQGSQYQGMLRSLVIGTDYYQEAEAALRRLALPSFESMAWQSNPSLDLNPVVTQISLLVADWLMFCELESRGLRADCFLGHSFGEFAALVAAGVIDLEQALRLTRLRAEALQNTPEGGLISVQASAVYIQDILAHTPHTITHFNSPDQTVLGGSSEELEKLRVILQEHRLNHRILKVPGALHTELVQAAQEPLREALEKAHFQPPNRLFISNVSNRFTSEPSEIKANLVEQLVTPVRYVELVQKIVDGGVGLLVEVGPGRTLSSLHRSILGDSEVIVLASDNPRRGPEEQIERLAAVFEALDLTESEKVHRRRATTHTPGSVEHFDATAARKQKGLKKTPSSRLQTSNEIERYLLDFVVDLTGYPREVIDFDWDLEADLGLDSIKQTQLFGELIDLVGEGDVGDLSQSEFRSLREILSWLEGASGQTETQVIENLSEVPPDRDFQAGLDLGKRHRENIRQWLRKRVEETEAVSLGKFLAPESSQKILGMARGAGVHHLSLHGLDSQRFPWEKPVTSRYVLRMVASPLPENAPTAPKFSGAALVLGQGELADALCQSLDIPVFRVENREQLAEITEPLPHLFITTAATEEARTAPSSWQTRREAFMEVYWLCQEWFRRVKRQKLENAATVVAATSMGGDLGLTGAIESAEGGALTGLLKALCIELWVSGHRGIPLRVVDSDPDHDSQSRVRAMLGELAISRYEVETGWIDGERHIVRAFPQPLEEKGKRPSGTWVCTGGGRGITAHVVQKLVEEYDLKVHILGRAPLPKVKEEWREFWPARRSELKVAIMKQARLDKTEPVKAWREVEKALELEGSLEQIPGAVYHSVDVSDHDALSTVLQSIRNTDGPIRGILHGAGASRDARFEQKDPVWVEQCVRAKLDGTAALMHLTREDPLEYFVAFGSISGRFGANGHTDYSMSNDMMAKMVGWYRSQRPQVASTTFHWHAWGDVGMATRPETELGLQMIAMQFMPAKEGLEHLMKELEAGLPESEVLITDDRYHRLFNPGQASQDKLPPLLREALPSGDGWIMEFDPKVEPFLKDHRLHGDATLPLAVALEIIAETALPFEDLQGPIELNQVRANEALLFYLDNPKSLQVQLESDGVLRVRTDVVSRDGQLLKSDRLICEALVKEGPDLGKSRYVAPEGKWQEVDYGQDLGFYHGPCFRGLRNWRQEGDILWGQIVAPGTAYLLSPSRDSQGWRLPSGTLDACFYAVGLFFCLTTGSESAPESAQSLSFARPPEPAEECLLRVEKRGDKFDFLLQGENGDILIRAKDYSVSLLSAGVKAVRR